MRGTKTFVLQVFLMAYCLLHAFLQELYDNFALITPPKLTILCLFLDCLLLFSVGKEKKTKLRQRGFLSPYPYQVNSDQFFLRGLRCFQASFFFDHLFFACLILKDDVRKAYSSFNFSFFFF